MSDILDFRPLRYQDRSDDAREAVDQAILWTEEATAYFEETTVDYVALQQVLRALEAVRQGIDVTQAMRKQGLPHDRTYRPKDESGAQLADSTTFTEVTDNDKD